jgi:predicted NBD/HSP70 family sugar kinase
MLIAVDTGGTKTLVGGFDHGGNLGALNRFETPNNQEDYVLQLQETIATNYNLDDIDGIVIALPGVIKNNKLLWCSNLDWQDFDISEILISKLGRPVWVMNDAKLAALAEAQNYPNDLVLYVTISTGIGIGIVHEKKLIVPLNQSEAGRMVLEYDGIVREWQSFASGHAIYNTYGNYARDIHNHRIWQQISKKISSGLLALVPTIQPDTIVIGGSIGGYLDRYYDYLTRILDEKLPAPIIRPAIKQAVHPEEAVIYGCYHYATTRINF